ncbi:MAG TPA: ammonium transporter [Steroidobacteraceae bacterium]|jgi:Amt family ammonium transporter|nr:ammonium transporter [Steroidobacteraceae bacterium]
MQSDKKRTKGGSLMRSLGAALPKVLGRKPAWLATGVFGALAAFAPGLAAAQEAAAAAPVPNKGDTAWMIVATLLVIMMTVPGLALFYGGMVRAKNVLSTFMQVFIIFSVCTVLWVIYGYSLAFNGPGEWIGDTSRFLMHGLTADSNAATFTSGVVIPEFVFVAFQATFAGITTALAIGAFAERTKFGTVLLWAVLWFTFAYLPIARMVWYAEGYLFKLGALDYAGGTVVHINAGIAGLVGALIVGKRTGYGTAAMPPHNVPYVMIGAAMLWVGWFGFNVGSGLEANNAAGLVFLNTYVCTAVAALAWTFGEWIFRGKPTMLGAASGAVAGLVAITPSCGVLGPSGAIILGIVVGLVCLWACAGLKKMLGYDDSLDVFGVHCIGGIIGALSCAILGHPSLGGVGTFESIGAQFGVQALGVAITLAWSGTVSAIIFLILKPLIGLRPNEETEREGLDISEHGERAYD